MKMFVAGEWVETSQVIEVKNPFDGTVVDTVPRASARDVDVALAAAAEGAKIMRKITGYERARMLRKAFDLMLERQEDLARTLSLEGGKVIGEARLEASRAAQTIELSAEEAKRLTGEVLPLDGGDGVVGKIGLTLRVPCGIVVAITPFNFPLNLVCHKVGPALAGGNAVVIKPTSDTPLVALKLVEILLEAGVPPLAVSCITGSGREIGDALCGDPRVRKISFTGSREVGEHICKMAGIKKVTMELGSNSPLVIMDDADMEKVAAATAITGFAHAGQICISAQRIIAMDGIYEEYLDALKPKVEAIKVGNPIEASTKMGPLIREADAIRVHEWIQEAVAGGARLVCGGGREGSICQPTVLADVQPTMRISCDELFGPAVAVTRASNVDEAIRIANDTNYGLSAAIFTQNIDTAMRFAQEVDSGNIHINWGTVWRTDLMPYGGLKESGMGKEGPKYAVQEMTELKTVVIHGPA
jgi:glyceraldehyde-3-phosphate dehydrogenase (NADP+)